MQEFHRDTVLKWNTLQNWPLVENPQFFFKQRKTWAKLFSHEVDMLTEFHDVLRKIVDFPFLANFVECPILEWSSSRK